MKKIKSNIVRSKYSKSCTLWQDYIYFLYIKKTKHSIKINYKNRLTFKKYNKKYGSMVIAH
jgi:hypothetical protein